MTLFRPGLRAEILFSLTLLLVAAMTLTSFVVLRITERDLLRYKTADGLAVVAQIQAVVDRGKKEAGPLDLEEIKTQLRDGLSWMVQLGLYRKILVIGTEGDVWVGDDNEKSDEPEDSQIATVFTTQKPMTRINPEKTLLTVSAPIYDGDRCIAAARIPVRIDMVNEGLRKSRLLIWFYIGLNVLVLVVFGNFLLSRIVIKPIKRLVKMADHFEETDLFSVMAKSEKNEMAHLTMALHRMVKRLAEHKDRLEAHIRSLEAANLELKRAREEVIRSEKLSSLGRLAAGVAHEVGNPIGSILGYTNLLMDHVAGEADAVDYLQRIEKEVNRINAIVRELLDFSRPAPSEPVAVDVNELVSESASFLARQALMAYVQVKTELENGVGVVWADADQLKQVLINLMLNARDAMEGSGTLTLATRRIVCDEAEEGPDESAAERIEIAVSDAGKGISPEEINRIFDPFYTTKPPGEGTGLGLAISLRLVETFGGSIHVRSVEGEGSTFTLSFPAYEPNHDTE